MIVTFRVGVPEFLEQVPGIPGVTGAATRNLMEVMEIITEVKF